VGKGSLIIFVSLKADKSSFELLASHCKGTNPFTPLLYSNKLFDSLSPQFDSSVQFSIPPIGAFPFHSDLAFISKKQSFATFSFCNVWGLRNLSISHHLKSKVKKDLHSIDFSRYSSVQIVGVETHYFILSICNYIKKRIPHSSVTIVVPDLPEFMNGGKSHFFYRLAKKVDNHRIYALLKTTSDGYVFLSDSMKSFFDVQTKPYQVLEGISQAPFLPEELHLVPKRIVYTGRTDLAYSDLDVLCEAIALLKKEDPQYELVVAGSGGGDAFLKSKAEAGELRYLGSLTPDETIALQQSAAVLVCMRKPLERFKYAFPSKILDYCRVGRPIVSNCSASFPQEYQKIVLVPSSDHPEDVAKVIQKAASLSPSELEQTKADSDLLCQSKGPANVSRIFETLFAQYRNEAPSLKNGQDKKPQ